MIRLLIYGAGRMARGVLEQLPDNPHYTLVGVVSRSQPVDEEGQAIEGLNWFPSLQDCDTPVDLLIDFTLPTGTAKAASWCEQHTVAMLSGTTGLDDEDIESLKKASAQVPVLWAPNLSYGVALLTKLVRQTADALGTAASITISETHHEKKLDAPSGTALALGAAVVEGRSEPLEELLESDRLDKMADSDEGELDFISVREGDVIGDHTVAFEISGEVFELTHKALDRGVFATGAIKAGSWLVKQPPGYYNTSDWLNL